MGSKKIGVGSVENYNSLKDTHLAHYFSRQDVLRHLVHMGLVTRAGEIVPETEWKKIYAKKQRQEKEQEKENHRIRLLDAEEAAKRRVKQKIRRREAQLARQPSASEPDLIHFDIEWSFRPVSVTTEGGARTSSETQGTSNGTSDDTSGGPNETSGPSDGLSYDTNGSKGRHERGQLRISGFSGSSPETATQWRKPNKYPSKPRFIGRRGVVGEPYVASLGPNPSPRYIHIIRPTNSCREVWSRLCPPQPICSRPPRAPSPPHLRLVYARGGAPCHTPTDLALLQQPAGSHNITVFHGVVQEGDEIEFTSFRREGFPFSLTIYEHGVTTGRLSACCEHRYASGSRLGGPSGHLRVVEIVGGEPCLRCQLRTVEKRHQLRQQMKAKSKSQRLRPYTPPEETGSETGSHSGESSGSRSSRSSDTKSSQNSQISIKGSSQSLSDSDNSSTDIEDEGSQSHKQKNKREKQTCRFSSDSCNGPSDLEVAAVLGVTSGTSNSPKKLRGRRKRSTSRKASPSDLQQHSDSGTEKQAGQDSKSKRKGYSEARRLSKATDQKSSRDSSDDQKPYHISSSLEGQLDDAIKGRSKYQKKSKIAFGSRQSSSKSLKSRSDRSRSRQSNGDGFNSQTKVDSFYSQQTFTSSASENQAASDNATEASYGSSWEEDEEDDKESEGESKEEDGSIVENKEVSETTDGKEEEMDTENEENVRTVSSATEEEACSEKENLKETDEEVDSEVISNVSSKADTVKESDRSGGGSISEDVGDDSDIVGLSCSEEEVIEEKEDTA